MTYTTEQYLDLKNRINDGIDSGDIDLYQDDPYVTPMLNDVMNCIYDAPAKIITENLKDLILYHNGMYDEDTYQTLSQILFGDNLEVLPLHINDGYKPIVHWRILQLTND